MGKETNHSTEKEMSRAELEALGEGTDVPWGGDQTLGGQHWLKGVVKRSQHTSFRSLCTHTLTYPVEVSQVHGCPTDTAT